jgi:hypothetical protein
MPVYLYPQFDRLSGFIWNIVAEMERLTGIKCMTSDVATGDGIQTAYHFDQELTAQQKTILDNLVAEGGAYPNAQALETVFEIDDLWEQLSTILVNMGLNPAQARLRFGDIVLDENNIPRTTKMRLYCGKVLTKQEETKVLSTYASLIRKL